MTKITWKSRWETSTYRQKYISFIILAICLLIAMPFGFDFIQNRGGLNWNDELLNLLPAVNFSVPIFVLMYSLAILIAVRVIQNPHLLLLFLQSYIAITVLRFILIYLIPLDPPKEMVELVDPITRIFYGGKLITRDLFFSGHTSTMLLITLVLQKKNDKIFGYFVTIFIAFALLFQHVHYTVDVLAAFPITWFIWKNFSAES